MADDDMEPKGQFDDIDNLDDLLGGTTPESAPEEAPIANTAPTEGAAPIPDSAEFYGWQICLADQATNSLNDADDFPDYIVNRETITQMLGVGMSSGQNAFPLNGQLFVVAVGIQVGDPAKGEGQIKLIGPEHPRYKAVSAVISEELLKGQDRGMVADLPSGQLVAIKPPTDPTKL